jgi:diamine N-acetyltransferase
LIRRATPADAARVAEFGARTFIDTFGAGNRAEDIAAHVSRTYSISQQTADLTDMMRTTLIAEYDGELAAFAQLRRGPAPDTVTGPAPIELLRFYVDRPWHGRGLANELMDAVVREARNANARTLWLCVFERNPRAIAFYAKQRFQDVGSTIFVLGTDPQTDRIMTRSLDD